MVVVINRLKDPPTWLNEATTIEMPPILTHLHLFVILTGRINIFVMLSQMKSFNTTDFSVF